MDWKSEAIDKLRQYEVKRQSLVSIPLELAQIESALTGIRSAHADGVAVKGGSSKYEDRILNCLTQKEELQAALECAQMWVDNVQAALDILDPKERKVLDRIYITGEKKPWSFCQPNSLWILKQSIVGRIKRFVNSLSHFMASRKVDARNRQPGRISPARLFLCI